MRPISEQDHYEVLEVPRGASSEDLRRAYQLATTTYQEDSMAGYSIFDSGDVEAVRERIDLAWRVLSDEDTRRAYDASLRPREPKDAPPAEPVAEPVADLTPAPAPAPALESIEAFEAEEGNDYDGARLRRTRLRHGLEIDDVARQTKVNPTYLRFIEEERFADLPARVYVRGFVMSFAACVGLDPEAVARSYLQRLDGARPEQRRWFSPARGD
ncbi:MAG: helix-turn-helix domain-containing protein [Myxococcota bacterium]